MIPGFGPPRGAGRHRSNILSPPGSPLLLGDIRPGRGWEAGCAAGGHHPEGFATTSCREGLGSPDDMGWTRADPTPSLLPHSGSLPVILDIVIDLEPGIKAARRLAVLRDAARSVFLT